MNDRLKTIDLNYCCLVVTLRCMMQCKMCHIWEECHSPADELTIREWKGVVKSLDGLLDKKHDIIISGGEPFLKKDILDLVSFSTRSGYRVSLDTNGYLIDDRMAKAIADAGLWRICISLDSLDADTHDFLRGKKEAFSRAMQAIQYLHQYAPQTGINIQAVIMEKNLGELKRLAEWVAGDERLDYIYFQSVVRPFGPAVSEQWFKDPRYDSLWPQDIKRVTLAINELIRLKPLNPKIVNSLRQFKTQLSYFSNPLDFVPEKDCSIGQHDININPQGDVFLCFAQQPVGNIKNRDLKQLWHSTEAAALRKVINQCKKPCHFLLNCSFPEGDD